jgi:hypothetical protein
VSTAELDESSHTSNGPSTDTSHGTSYDASVAPRKVARHRPEARSTRWHALFAVALLAVLATAVALVLAQSAGAIHLGFLGPVA